MHVFSYVDFKKCNMFLAVAPTVQVIKISVLDKFLFLKSSFFVGRNRKSSIIRKKRKISGLSGVSGAGWRKWTLDLDSTGQKILKSITSVCKIPAISKI